MSPAYRKKLLAIMARIEQQIAEAECLTVEVSDYETLWQASKQLGELRRVLADVEEKLLAANWSPTVAADRLEVSMVEKETVLELGVEGGGVTVFRTRHDRGEWHFHVEGSSMYLDDNDDEVWRSWSTEPVCSIKTALREVADDGCWVFFWPIAIHPEYRTAMSKLVRAAVAKLPAKQKQMGRNQLAEWRRLCQEESVE
jgi:hypothetical protein